MTKKTACALTALAALAPAVALAPAAVADDSSGHDKAVMLHATLNPFKVNKVTGSGTATVHLEGNKAHVTVKHSGLLAGAPHAQHFHINAKGVCPPETVAKKRNGNLSLNTTDGAPFYGGIGTSLTTTGDTSPDSGLAIDRFPTGDKVHYERTITLSDEAAKSLREGTGVVVVHGIDYNGNGKYDNVLGPSDLDPSLPSEATNPALCGPLRMAAKGAVHGGLGGTQDSTVNTAAAAAGATLLAGAAAYGLRRRRANQS
jgi:LPXTG-motif cell wall-anchored protein